MGWIFEGKELEEIPIGYVGYVYKITNVLYQKYYIGAKVFFFSKSKKLKSRKNRVRFRTESDWKSYWSSSPALKSDVEKLGEEHFTREVLYLCKNKEQLKYLEAREIIDQRALELDSYYNELLYCRLRKRKDIINEPSEEE